MTAAIQRLDFITNLYSPHLPLNDGYLDGPALGGGISAETLFQERRSLTREGLSLVGLAADLADADFLHRGNCKNLFCAETSWRKMNSLYFALQGRAPRRFPVAVCSVLREENRRSFGCSASRAVAGPTFLG